MDIKKLNDLKEAVHQFRLSRTTRGSHESLRNDHADEGFALVEQIVDAITGGNQAEPVAITQPTEETEHEQGEQGESA